MEKLYAQFDENGVCFCVGTPKTDVEATDANLGQKYVDGIWQDVVQEPVPIQPTNSQVAQMISDLQADMIIAGVIK